MYKNSFFHKKNQTTAIQILGLFININLNNRKIFKKTK
ncbi:hypothetical protein LEP1GSC034_2066 [Leptospira interrogans str. 2003000735]|uniref:Uncharacterized protein n=1 Tax=Leptospira interrogans str. 2002000626 TaxID=996803 RepID=A0A829CSD0_LEPIR|nr:hypothetical protein LEP1GSC027_0274 [Leptospira interrogans str. 2002000624]EKQ40059.1 hypothetical protein LEP1GSC025_2069 [Leptospira interrogans str. 2002000621]EKQ47278.1 hypothetical protein LEP1GSC026_1975 [Leptospira interrogans str. 2002000623]EMJ75464.1 hypothetical protein LEP1GSC034_2066 [Leptospira interrogans str. 2003000735]EMJ76523.1 hypothetical protein LEP1GSC033_1071 [Leptospira interrogans str. 2002000632]EMJ79193.1 hypothetical protein LEP1GSC032_3146 [Leptospira interr